MDSYMIVSILSACSLASSSHYPSRTFIVVHQVSTWGDAQRYCRAHYSDLATFQSADEYKWLPPDFNFKNPVWIGLSDLPRAWKAAPLGKEPNSWRWSSSTETDGSNYQNWRSRSPSRLDQHCVVMRDGAWQEELCPSKLTFVCHRVTNQTHSVFYYISNLYKTWADARQHCRDRFTDLAVIRSGKENSEVSFLIPPSVPVWIGLYRVPWAWSDWTPSSYRNWAPGNPDNYKGEEFCAGIERNYVWRDLPCTDTWYFICQQENMLKTMVMLEFRTTADLCDPVVQAGILEQLGAIFESQNRTDIHLQFGQCSKQKKQEL